MKNIILLSFLVLMTTTVFAQSTSPGEVRDTMNKACSEDFQKYCPKIKDSTQMEACIKRNVRKYSPKCKVFLVELKMITAKPVK